MVPSDHTALGYAEMPYTLDDPTKVKAQHMDRLLPRLEGRVTVLRWPQADLPRDALTPLEGPLCSEGLRTGTAAR
jgi:hypothetical protein